MFAQILEFKKPVRTETTDAVVEAIGALNHNLNKMNVQRFAASDFVNGTYRTCIRSEFSGHFFEVLGISTTGWADALLDALEQLHGHCTYVHVVLNGKEPCRG